MTNALESIAQEISRTVAELTMVPSIPRTAPITKPMQARIFRLLSAAAFIAVRGSSSKNEIGTEAGPDYALDKKRAATAASVAVEHQSFTSAQTGIVGNFKQNSNADCTIRAIAF